MPWCNVAPGPGKHFTQTAPPVRKSSPLRNCTDALPAVPAGCLREGLAAERLALENKVEVRRQSPEEDRNG
jgi:hypothetical protein